MKYNASKHNDALKKLFNFFFKGFTRHHVHCIKVAVTVKK